MLETENKVVVQFRDGRTVKGRTYNFKPNREIFHVTEAYDEKKIIEVSMSLLKAIFFVKNLEGNIDHRSSEDFSMESLRNVRGLKIKITFSDGEVMYGKIHSYTPDMKGFSILPADKESNIERAFVLRESTVEVETFG